MKLRSRAACLVLALALAGLAPAACGKKGPPELPEGQTDQYPRQYPDPSEL
ncbi:MAG: hypothetical protein BroJett029_15880 [Alphaproteobacteria bacterium]|nr:MAG: hypothetical protein BroJett029_15880 [Alphaproteobacteria bacterium]